MGKWTRRAFIGTGALVGGGFVLGVTGAALAPSRHSVRSDDAGSDRPAEHLDPGHARQHRHRARAALRDGPGRADGAGDDGGGGNGRRLEPRALQGSAGARRLRQRLHRPRVHPTCPDRSSAASTTAPTGSRAWRAAGHRRLAVGAGHRAVRHARRRRRREGDAGGRRGRAVRRAARRSAPSPTRASRTPRRAAPPVSASSPKAAAHAVGARHVRR